MSNQVLKGTNQISIVSPRSLVVKNGPKLCFRALNPGIEEILMGFCALVTKGVLSGEGSK